MAEVPPKKKVLTREEILGRIAALPNEEDRAKAMRVLALKYQSTASFDRTPQAKKLEDMGWRAWLYTMAPHVFSQPFEDFDEKYWDWLWALLMAKRDGTPLVNLDTELAYLDTLSRGLGKSTKAEWSVIMIGCVLGGQVLCLYVSSTSGLAEGHLNNIREELESSQVEEYYPRMANPEVGKFGNRYGWNQALLATQSGLTVFAVGLQEEVRGVKKRNLRPFGIFLDEFDSKNDTPDVVKKKESIIGGSIFGTQVADTLIVMLQNLIHAGSVASRTYKRRNELLSRRRESGLVKAFTDDLEIEMVGTRYRATKGKPRYSRLNLANFQKYLDTSGPVECFAEYQHQFDRNREGKVLHNYNDLIMVLTEDQFFSVYKCKKPPAAWNKYVFNDYARTKSEFHANVGGTLSMSGMNTPLPGITFLYDCLSFEAATEADDCAIEFLKCISPTVWAQGIEYQWEILLHELMDREGIGKFTATLTEKIKAQRQGLARVIPKYVAPLLASQHYTRFRMSHERDDWTRIYRETFGLPFEPALPTEGAGVDLINFTMKVDPTVADPFGRVIYDSESGRPTPLMGMSRFYIIVPNGKEAYPNDNQPDRLHGTDLARYQFTEHRYLQPKQNALGEMERGQEKRNDDFCFVAGTMVTTSAGDVPIEQVRVGDYAWTRAGWRRVTASGMTSPNAEIYTLETSAGELHGTGNHPVWVEGKGFVPLRVLSMDDTLHPCPTVIPGQFPSESFFRALPSIATPSPSGSHIDATIFRTLKIERKALATFTSKYGSQFTALYRRVLRSTTWIITSITTILTIWARSLAVNTQAFTLENVSLSRRIWWPRWPIWTGYDLSRTLGIQLPKELNGTANTVKLWFESSIRKFASFVTKNTKPAFPPTAGFVRASAGSDFGTGSPWEPKLEPAPSVEILLRRTPGSTHRSAGRLAIPVDVVGLKSERFLASDAKLPSKRLDESRSTARLPVVKRVRKSGVAPVYNLQVEGQPEYFANGILVHNCNGLQFFYMDHSIQARELTPEEMAEAHMASHLQLSSIKAEEDPETREKMMMQREISLMKEQYDRIMKQVSRGPGRRKTNAMADYRKLDRLRR